MEMVLMPTVHAKKKKIKQIVLRHVTYPVCDTLVERWREHNGSRTEDGATGSVNDWKNKNIQCLISHNNTGTESIMEDLSSTARRADPAVMLPSESQ